jgi:peptidoglycan/xylan/chitin deacetylase (PgdA/CDA1 family)
MYALHPMKAILASLLARTRVTELFFHILSRRPYIRIINYHDTPEAHRGRLEQHLLWYRTFFQPVNREMLDNFLEDGYWPYKKPGIIISFDDGLRSNIDVAAPLLEKYGFCGWFFVPASFLECPAPEQARFAENNLIPYTQGYPDGRLAMTREELRRLAGKHVIGCHTMTHCRLGDQVPPHRMFAEVSVASAVLSEWMGMDIDLFCWVGGEEWTYSRRAAEQVCKAGYRYGFMTNNLPVTRHSDPLQLQRTNIASDWPMDVLEFQLCGILDLLYIRKRRKVVRLTDCGRSSQPVRGGAGGK